MSSNNVYLNDLPIDIFLDYFNKTNHSKAIVDENNIEEKDNLYIIPKFNQRDDLNPAFITGEKSLSSDIKIDLCFYETYNSTNKIIVYNHNIDNIAADLKDGIYNNDGELENSFSDLKEEFQELNQELNKDQLKQIQIFLESKFHNVFDFSSILKFNTKIYFKETTIENEIKLWNIIFEIIPYKYSLFKTNTKNEIIKNKSLFDSKLNEKFLTHQSALRQNFSSLIENSSWMMKADPRNIILLKDENKEKLAYYDTYIKKITYSSVDTIEGNYIPSITLLNKSYENKIITETAFIESKLENLNQVCYEYEINNIETGTNINGFYPPATIIDENEKRYIFDEKQYGFYDEKTNTEQFDSNNHEVKKIILNGKEDTLNNYEFIDEMILFKERTENSLSFATHSKEIFNDNQIIIFNGLYYRFCMEGKTYYKYKVKNEDGEKYYLSNEKPTVNTENHKVIGTPEIDTFSVVNINDGDGFYQCLYDNDTGLEKLDFDEEENGKAFFIGETMYILTKGYIKDKRNGTIKNPFGGLISSSLNIPITKNGHNSERKNSLNNEKSVILNVYEKITSLRGSSERIILTPLNNIELGVGIGKVSSKTNIGTSQHKVFGVNSNYPYLLIQLNITSAKSLENEKIQLKIGEMNISGTILPDISLSSGLYVSFDGGSMYADILPFEDLNEQEKNEINKNTKEIKSYLLKLYLKPIKKVKNKRILCNVVPYIKRNIGERGSTLSFKYSYDYSEERTATRTFQVAKTVEYTVKEKQSYIVPKPTSVPVITTPVIVAPKIETLKVEPPIAKLDPDVVMINTPTLKNTITTPVQTPVDLINDIKVSSVNNNSIILANTPVASPTTSSSTKVSNIVASNSVKVTNTTSSFGGGSSNNYVLGSSLNKGSITSMYSTPPISFGGSSFSTGKVGGFSPRKLRLIPVYTSTTFNAITTPNNNAAIFSINTPTFTFTGDFQLPEPESSNLVFNPLPQDPILKYDVINNDYNTEFEIKYKEVEVKKTKIVYEEKVEDYTYDVTLTNNKTGETEISAVQYVNSINTNDDVYIIRSFYEIDLSNEDYLFNTNAEKRDKLKEKLSKLIDKKLDIGIINDDDGTITFSEDPVYYKNYYQSTTESEKYIKKTVQYIFNIHSNPLTKKLDTIFLEVPEKDYENTIEDHFRRDKKYYNNDIQLLRGGYVENDVFLKMKKSALKSTIKNLLENGDSKINLQSEFVSNNGYLNLYNYSKGFNKMTKKDQNIVNRFVIVKKKLKDIKEMNLSLFLEKERFIKFDENITLLSGEKIFNSGGKDLIQRISNYKIFPTTYQYEKYLSNINILDYETTKIDSNVNKILLGDSIISQATYDHIEKYSNDSYNELLNSVVSNLFTFIKRKTPESKENITPGSQYYEIFYRRKFNRQTSEFLSRYNDESNENISEKKVYNDNCNISDLLKNLIIIDNNERWRPLWKN